MSQEEQKTITREQADAALLTLRVYAAQRQTGEVTNLRTALSRDATDQTFDSVATFLDTLPEAVDE